MNGIVQSGKNKNLFSAMIRWQFMTVVQLHHPYWESIVVLKYHLASSLQAMRYWFNFELILVSQKVDLDWNIQEPNIHTRVRHTKLILVIIINYLTLNYIMFHVSAEQKETTNAEIGESEDKKEVEEEVKEPVVEKDKVDEKVEDKVDNKVDEKVDDKVDDKVEENDEDEEDSNDDVENDEVDNDDESD